MSTAAEVRAAWASKIWAHTSITALTTKVYNFDLESLADISTAHKALMYYNQRINFFQYRVSKTWAFGLSSSRVAYRYPVIVRYYREAMLDTSGTIFNAVEDAFETLNTLVRTQLTTNWNGTIDYYEPQVEAVSLDPIALDDKVVWVGQFSFQGYKETSL